MEVVGRPLGTERSPNTPSPRAGGAGAFELERKAPDPRASNAAGRRNDAESPEASQAGAHGEQPSASPVEADTTEQATDHQRRDQRGDEPEPVAPEAGHTPPDPTADPLARLAGLSSARLDLPHTGSAPPTTSISAETVPSPTAAATSRTPSTPVDLAAAPLIDAATGPAEPALAELASSDEAGRPTAGSVGETKPLQVVPQPAPAEPASEPARAAAPPPAPARPSAEAMARAADILHQVKVGIVPELGQATIRLAPRELGRISISLTLERGRAHATLRAERPETLEALARHVPELRAAFEQRGVEPGDIRLELLDRHAPDGRSQEPEHGHGRNDGRRGSSAAPATELDVSRAALARTLSDEAVDLYA